MKTKRVTTANRLGTYLTATVGTSLLASVQSDAAIVTINIGSGPGEFNIGGTNAGLTFGSYDNWNNFPVLGGGKLEIYNTSDYKGLDGDDSLQFAILGGYASPKNFSSGGAIGVGSSFSDSASDTLFKYYGDESDPFGSGSFMGFRTALGQYGWLEVTWDGDNFEILSGAYQDEVGVAINAGDTGASAIPEPASVLSTMGLLASGLLIRRRKQAA